MILMAIDQTSLRTKGYIGHVSWYTGVAVLKGYSGLVPKKR